MLEEHLVPFLQFLRERRYARMTIRLTQVAVSEFLMYLSGRAQDAQGITVEHLRDYLLARSRIFLQLWNRRMPPGYERRLAEAIGLFLRYLAGRGIRTGIPIRQKRDKRAVPGYEALLNEYEKFMRDHHGLRPRSIDAYLDHAARLCCHMGEARIASWDVLTPRLLYEHLRRQARHLGHTSFRGAQTALRNFFSFLRVTGKCRRDPAASLVSYRAYRLVSVPRTVSDETLFRMFDDVKGDVPADIRDRALLLLLTLYGLRISEIARLRMDDVRWREQQIVIRARKMGRDLVLPLHPAVARALWEYVDRVRPRGTVYREVFLTSRVPQPYSKGCLLGHTLSWRFKKLGLKFHPHAMRHTLASRLINNSCPPEWIQHLLGHASFDSTRIYAKVDMEHLREVADNEGVDL